MAEEEPTTNGKVKEEDETETPAKPQTEDIPQLEEKIIRQVEYYFGDINLCKDKFLQSQVKLDDGWVPIETMLKFKRLAQLSTDPDKIVASLAKSESKLMEISEDKKKIRRNPDKPVPEMNEERRKELMCRTVYIKGFPKDSQLSELLDFFAQKWKYENIVMRNYQDKKTKTWNFKGSVFLVFPTVEEAKAFLEEKEFTYKDGEMIRMWQSDYIDQKRKEYDERKKSQKKKPDEDAGGEGKDEEAEKEDDGLPRGTIVKVTGLKGDIGREDLKEKIEGMGLAVAFVDFSMGKDEGWIRLEEKDAAKELMTKLTDDKMTVKDVDVSVQMLEGEDETEYMNKVKKEQMKRRQNQKNSRRRGRGGGGRGAMRKRKGSPSREGPTPAKVKAE